MKLGNSGTKECKINNPPRRLRRQKGYNMKATIKFSGRAVTEKERNYLISLAPEGTTEICVGIVEWFDRFVGCARFFDNEYNKLKEQRINF